MNPPNGEGPSSERPTPQQSGNRKCSGPVFNEADPRYQPPPDYPGPPQLETSHACLSCDNPAVWTSPTGHHFCQECRDVYQAVMPGSPEYRFEPVNFDQLLSADPPTEDWSVEPILPRGKLTGAASKRGDGKSLLFLEAACRKAAGDAFLDQEAGEPEHVVYLDMEMGPDDLYDRVNDLGYGLDNPKYQTLKEHLHYYQLTALPPLNTEEGGQALEEIVDRHHPTLLVIDTLARVIEGNENDAPPYQELFRYSETMLKRRRITLARLDHLGKDKEKGSRGSSAKEDGLDVVWHLSETAIEGTLQLTLTKGRQNWLPHLVTIHRVEDDAGIVTHKTNTAPIPQKIIDLAAMMDDLEIPANTGTPTAQKVLKEAGFGKRRSDIRLAVRYRRGRDQKPGPPPDHLSGPLHRPGGTTAKETQQTLRESDGTTIGTTPDQSEGVVPSLGDGPPPDHDQDEFDLDAYESVSAAFEDAADIDFELTEAEVHLVAAGLLFEEVKSSGLPNPFENRGRP